MSVKKEMNQLEEIIEHAMTENKENELEALLDDYEKRCRAHRYPTTKLREYRRRLEDIDNDALEVLKLSNRQLITADKNQETLSKSTLKLIGLDYTNSDIDKAIAEAEINAMKFDAQRRKEMRNIRLGIGIFLLVCVAILIDKIRIRFDLI